VIVGDQSNVQQARRSPPRFGVAQQRRAGSRPAAPRYGYKHALTLAVTIDIAISVAEPGRLADADEHPDRDDSAADPRPGQQSSSPTTRPAETALMAGNFTAYGAERRRCRRT